MTYYNALECQKKYFENFCNKPSYIYDINKLISMANKKQVNLYLEMFSKLFPKIFHDSSTYRKTTCLCEKFRNGNVNYYLMVDPTRNIAETFLKDIEFSKPKHAAVIGKAIWETIVKYYCLKLGMKFIKLSKDNFKWGKVEVGSDERYNSIIELLYSQLPSGTAIYVFPNTSGLVASLSFQEKLQLWQNLAGNI